MASASPTPQPSGYASPALSASSAPSASKAHPHPHHAKAKPVNVFSNDGSFLERFQHLKKDEEEKKKQEEVLVRKREFEDRFKRRGKRKHPDESSSSPVTETPADTPAKKTKTDSQMAQYSKEVKNLAGRSLKDDGIGVRPLVK